MSTYHPHVIRAASMAALAAIAGTARFINGPMPGGNVEELRETVEALTGRLKLVSNQTRSIAGRAESAGRDLTQAESTKLDALMAEFDGIERELKVVRAELTAAEAEEVNSTPMPRLAGPNRIATAGPNTRNAQPRPLIRNGRSYAEMFGRPTDTGTAFESLGDFARAVAMGNDARLIRNASGFPSTTTEGASAGYMVPDAFVRLLMDEALSAEVFRPRANVIPITSGNAIISGFDSKDRTGGKRAGLILDWQAGEAKDLLKQKARATQYLAKSCKGSIFAVVSSELLDDAPNFDAELGRAMVAALAGGLDLAFLSGTGAGQPLGYINGPSTITVAKESGQAANTVLLQNLAKMVGRLSPESFARAVWFVHPTVVPVLYQMSYTVRNLAGTENVGGALVQPITIGPDGGLRAFGLPMIVTDAVAPLSSLGDIVLCDPMRYNVALRQDVRLARDTSQYFSSDEVAFRLTIRLDGMPQDSGPTTLRDGTNTVSPCVVLQAR